MWHQDLIIRRPGCHLCDVMKAVVERVGQTVAVSLEEIDISSDPELSRATASKYPADDRWHEGGEIPCERGRLRRMLNSRREGGQLSSCPSRLFSCDQEMSAAILRPAGLGLFAAERLFFPC